MQHRCIVGHTRTGRPPNVEFLELSYQRCIVTRGERTCLCRPQASATFGPARNITRLGLGLRTAAGGMVAVGSRRGEAPVEIDMESQPSGSGEADVSGF